MTLVDSEYLKHLARQGQTHKVAVIFNNFNDLNHFNIRLYHLQEKVAGHFRVKQLHVKPITCTPHTLHPKKPAGYLIGMYGNSVWIYSVHRKHPLCRDL